MTSSETGTNAGGGTPPRARRTEHQDVVMRIPSPRRFLSAFLPDETVRHLYAARRERLLAVRSLIDAAIERIDQAESEVGRTSRPTDIRLD
jgi:hypothetical protein